MTYPNTSSFIYFCSSSLLWWCVWHEGGTTCHSHEIDQ